MTKYLLLFRDGVQDQTEDHIKSWDTYIGEIARKGKFVSGLPFGPNAKVIAGMDKQVSDYTSKEGSITAYMIIRASSLDEALDIAKGAPNLQFGGTVEVRSTIPPIQ